MRAKRETDNRKNIRPYIWCESKHSSHHLETGYNHLQQILRGFNRWTKCKKCICMFKIYVSWLVVSASKPTGIRERVQASKSCERAQREPETMASFTRVLLFSNQFTALKTNSTKKQLKDPKQLRNKCFCAPGTRK